MASQQKNTRYALIALPLPVTSVFTYLIPPELMAFAEVGKRALVPFGKRILTGFIVEVSDNPGDIPLSKMKSIHTILDKERVFDNHMLRLCTWIAAYYMASLGEVLKSAMPYGTMIKSRLRIHLTTIDIDPYIPLTDRQNKVLDILKNNGHILLKSLERSFNKRVLSTVRSLEKKGLVYLAL